ncbi:MAG: DUF4089 domain-containing protein [Xanthobacteraceae bacterium]
MTKGKAKMARAHAARKPAAKTKRVRKPAAGDALDTFVEAAARAFDLPLDPAWKGAVEANLQVTLTLAASFADFPLPDDAEPAPVFVA